jgi:hypothetical protein
MMDRRLECLKLAVLRQSCQRSDQVVAEARQYFNFISGISADDDVIGAAIVATEREIAKK